MGSLAKHGFPLAVAVFVIGATLSLNYKVELGQQNSLPYQRYQAAQELLQSAQKAKDDLAFRQALLQKKLAELPTSQSVARKVSNVSSGLARVGLVAGLAPLEGPGVEVVLQDSSDPLQQGEQAASLLVHDVDVLRTVNQLWEGGAEAISINGQRLIGTSQIRCAGPTISVNLVRTSTPIRILALGDPATLTAAVEDPAGIYPILTSWGIGFTVQAKDSLVIPPYRGGFIYKYAQRVPVSG